MPATRTTTRNANPPPATRTHHPQREPTTRNANPPPAARTHHPQREPTTRNANPPEDNMEFMSRYSAGLLALMGLHDESGV